MVGRRKGRRVVVEVVKDEASMGERRSSGTRTGTGMMVWTTKIDGGPLDSILLTVACAFVWHILGSY